MNPETNTTTPPKAIRKKLTEAQKLALQELRVWRGETQAERLKKHIAEGRQNRKKVREALEKGSATVPELAQASQLPTGTVLWQVTAMKKYGEVREKEVDGDYPRYELKPES